MTNDYGEKLVQVLTELDERLQKENGQGAGVKPFMAQIIGDFVLLPEPVVVDGANGDLPPVVKQHMEQLGSEWELKANWFNTDLANNGGLLEDLNVSVGDLHFYLAANCNLITVYAIERKDLLQVQLARLDHLIDVGAVTQEAIDDVRESLETLGITACDAVKSWSEILLYGDEISDLLVKV